MKRIQVILAAVAAIAATIAGLDLTGFVTVLPPEMAKWLVIIPSGAAAIVHIVQTVNFELQKLEEKRISEERDHFVPAFGLLVILTALLLLPSCSGDYPLTGSVTYRDPGSGAKGGLIFEPGKPPKASVRVPVYDPETGELVGVAEMSGPLSREVDPAK